ncbi:MAG: serine/threonine-protein kinase [Acidobacteriota bacterium]
MTSPAEQDAFAAAAASSPVAQPRFRAGDYVRDRYRILRLIGKGGMGEVYEAEDTDEGRRVALKTILRELISGEKALARFEREIELSQRVSHPNVLRIYDVFELDAGLEEGGRRIPCLVMELLDGETLADRLGREPRIDTDAAWTIVRQMCAGLGAAHRGGVIHRDLKPDNIFLIQDADGSTRAVLTDFGVARPLSGEGHRDEGSLDSLTATNVILGTPTYMAPEQLELEVATPASDIYTIGLVIYEMVTGKQPFEAESALKTVFKRIKEQPTPPSEHVPDLDPGWEAVILRCLARHPEDRFPDADAIADALPVPTAHLDATEDGAGGAAGLSTTATFVLIALGLIALSAALVWLL